MSESFSEIHSANREEMGGCVKCVVGWGSTLLGVCIREHPGNAVKLWGEGARGQASGKRKSKEEDEAPTAEIISG